jgi:hypothetical protein
LKTLRYLATAALAIWLPSFQLLAAPPGTTFEWIAETGVDVPGLPGITFQSLGNPQLNGAGDVAFFASLSGAGVSPSNNGVIYAQINGIPGVIARKGGPVSNQGGLTLAGMQHLTLTADGDVIFIGLLAGEGVDFANDGAVFLASRDGGVRTLAREGDAIDGTGLIIGGAAFDTDAPPLAVADENGNGEPDLVAFRPGGWVATAGSPNSSVQAMSYLRDGEMRIATKAGDLLPPQPGGLQQSLELGPSFTAVCTTALGVSTEMAFVFGADPTLLANGVCGVDANGNVKALAAAGQAAPGGKTEFKFFQGVGFARNGIEFVALAYTGKQADNLNNSLHGAFHFAARGSQLGHLWTSKCLAQREKVAPNGGIFHSFPSLFRSIPSLAVLQSRLSSSLESLP